MIRINLLGVDRQKVRKAAAFDIGQRLTLACSLILVAAALGIGWWYWSLNETSTRLDTDIADARAKQTQLASLLAEVRQFEARRTQLQQRVALIEQLRAGQSLPVQLLDHVSRALPDMLWLTQMEQTTDAVTIEGRSTTLSAVSEFTTNLGNSAMFQKPIEIVTSQAEAATAAGQGQGPSIDLIRFSVRAPIAKTPAAPVATVAAAAPGAPAPAAPPGGAR